MDPSWDILIRPAGWNLHDDDWGHDEVTYEARGLQYQINFRRRGGYRSQMLNENGYMVYLPDWAMKKTLVV